MSEKIYFDYEELERKLSKRWLGFNLCLKRSYDEIFKIHFYELAVYDEKVSKDEVEFIIENIQDKNNDQFESFIYDCRQKLRKRKDESIVFIYQRVSSTSNCSYYNDLNRAYCDYTEEDLYIDCNCEYCSDYRSYQYEIEHEYDD